MFGRARWKEERMAKGIRSMLLAAVVIVVFGYAGSLHAQIAPELDTGFGNCTLIDAYLVPMDGGYIINTVFDCGGGSRTYCSQKVFVGPDGTENAGLETCRSTWTADNRLPKGIGPSGRAW